MYVIESINHIQFIFTVPTKKTADLISNLGVGSALAIGGNVTDDQPDKALLGEEDNNVYCTNETTPVAKEV